MRRRLWLALVRSLVWVLAPIARKRTALGFALADRIGNGLYRMHLLGGAHRSLATLYARHGGGQAAVIGRALAADELRTRLFHHLAHGTDEAVVARLVEWDDPERVRAILRSGAVLAVWHMGPAITALVAKLTADDIPAGMFVWSANHPRPTSIEFLGTSETSGQTAVSFARAIEIVKAGRPVAIALDGKWGSDAPATSCLGRAIAFRRGFVALARITRAPVHALGTRWVPGDQPVRLSLSEAMRTSDQLPANEAEQELSDAAAAWLERHLTTTPASLSRGFSRLA